MPVDATPSQPPAPGDKPSAQGVDPLDATTRAVWERVVMMLDEHAVPAAPTVARAIVIALGSLDVDALDALIGAALRGTLFEQM